MNEQKKFRVRIGVYGYPNGETIHEDVKYFDTLDEAEKFKNENTFEYPDKTGVACLEVFASGYVLYE